MNIFVIPSWYPTAEDPSYGIFCRHTIEAMHTVAPAWRFGVAGWGQGYRSHKLFLREPLQNLRKWKMRKRSRFEKFKYTVAILFKEGSQ